MSQPASAPSGFRRMLLPLVAATSMALALGALKSQPVRGPTIAPERDLDRARELAREGRFAQAGALLKRHPPGASPAERLLRAQVAGALECGEEALAHLAEIPDTDPLGPLARLSQGQIEARRGRLRHAEAAFRACLRLFPKCVQALRELVYILTIQQRLDELDEPLAALSGLGSLDLKHLIHWGLVHHTQWSAAADLPALQRYAAADPDDDHSRHALVEALIRLGRLDEAEEDMDPNDRSDAAIALRAMLAEARGDLKRLETLLATGSERDLRLARHRGRRALARKDAADSIRWFTIANEIRPGDRSTLFGLASALILTGDRQSAGPLLEQVRSLDGLGTLLAEAESRPGRIDQSLARKVGLACSTVGREHEARAWLRFAIAKDPTDTESQQALARLSAGRTGA